MTQGITPPAAGLTRHDDWDDVAKAPGHAKRLERIRALAPAFKQDFLKAGPAVAVRTLPVARAPYLVTYGFNRACSLPYPYLLFQNRAVVIQFRQRGQLKTLLFNPTIPERSATAPFFAAVQKKLRAPKAVERAIVKEGPPLPLQLEALGLRADQIDYLAFDHQHVQDLRPYLGTSSAPSLYPNAKVLVQRPDWEASVQPHPLQRTWWVENSAEGARTENLVVLDGDYSLGDGVAIMATPGHTWGNQSLLFRAPESGCYTVSENGICADAYAPLRSKIPGLAAHARASGEEVVLNGNTLEGALDQYNSMVKEKLLADPMKADGEFVQHFSSSELVHTALAPGLKPTQSIGAVNEGELLLAKAESRAAS
ncbi:MAG: hypothetical protein JST54_10535 [Deltaproteobacteria bacterium]|nr:hypothetical protein [Deltaproteobacteria bacterium]